MKKYIAALAGLALSLSACQDLQEKDFMKTKALTLTASVEQPVGTRTLIAGDSQVWWEKGDEIKVFAGTKSARFVTDLTSPAATADFTGSLDGAWTEGSPLWAVYPFSEGAVLDGETLAVELPAVQVARAQSFAKGMNLSVARTTSPSLQFYNVGGGLCFTLTQEGITKVVFEGLDGETLAGKVKVAFQDERPVVQEVSEGSTSVTLSAPEGTTLEKGLWYYIVALPVALEKGFTLSFCKGDAVAKKTFVKTVAVKRSIYGEIRNADEGATYIPDTDENITFKDAKVKEIVVRYFDTGKDGELSYKEAAAVRSFFVDEALTRAEGEQVSVFAGTGITSFDEIQYFTGLTKIEAGTFEGCTALTSVTIPENTTEIGANAFKGCTNLQSIIVLAQTPPTIGADAFADTNNCPIIVPAGTADAYTAAWGEYAPRIVCSQPDNEIWYTTTDGEVIVPGYSAFQISEDAAFGAHIVSNEYVGGKGVITFDGPVTRCRGAFWSNLRLKTVLLPKTVDRILSYSFTGCRDLIEIKIPEGQTEIQSSTFHNCTSLSQIVFPNSLTTIGGSSFSGSGLKSITIPPQVNNISSTAFQKCSMLTSIVVSEDNPFFDSREGCNAIIQTSTNSLIRGCVNTTIPTSVTKIAAVAFSGCSGLYTVDLPNGVTELGGAAFGNCPDLTSITIPASTNKIEVNVFSACPVLHSVIVSSENPVYDSRDNCNAIIETATNTLIAGCPVSTIPESVSAIGQNAFSECSGLKTLTIPESVTSIGSMAFYSCPDLQKIICLATVPPTAASRIFYQTSCLIYVPAGSVEAYKAAEFWSDYADRIQALGSDTQPDNEIWYTSTDGQVVTPQYTLGNIDEETCFGAKIVSNEYKDGKGVISFDGDVKSLGYYAFYKCKTLLSISIPGKVTEIGSITFGGCSSLTELRIPAGVSAFGWGSTSECTSLETIVVSSENTVFDSRDGCNAVIETATNDLRAGCKKTTIPATVTTVSASSFTGIRTLTDIRLPEGITSIGAQAFHTTGMTRLSLPSTLREIGRRAFMNCSSLTQISCLVANPPELGTSAFDSTNDCPIFVPEASVNTYKTTSGWSSYATRIQADLSEMRTALENELMECQKMVVYLTQRLQQLPSSEQKARLAEQIDELAQVLNVVSQALLAATTQEQLTNVRYQIQDMQVQIAQVDEQLRQLGV